MKGISRVNESGWLVRITYKKVIHQRYFADRRFGGNDQARIAAIEWRDMTEQLLGKRRSEERVIGVSIRGEGVPIGVREVVRKGRHLVEVTWRKNKKSHRATLSVAKHGRAEALRRGIALRAQRLGQEDGADVGHRDRVPHRVDSGPVGNQPDEIPAPVGRPRRARAATTDRVGGGHHSADRHASGER